MQPVNTASDAFALASSTICNTPTAKECTEIYETATTLTAFNFFINPVGRSFKERIINRDSLLQRRIASALEGL